MEDLLARSGLRAPWLRTHGFADASTAFARLHGLLDAGTAPDAGGARAMVFGPQGGTAVLAAGEVPALSQYERYVQATAQIGSRWYGDSVIVRWSDLQANAVMELAAQPVPADANGQIPIWRFSQQDWTPGRYRVEVIAADSTLLVLAQGEFEIVPPDAPVTPFRFEGQDRTASHP